MGVSSQQLVRVHQVHGVTVVTHRIGEPSSRGIDADIVISNDPSVAVAVQTADCVPLLMADARTGAVAAAHAGWRGIAHGVPGITVNALARAFESQPADLVAVIGPAIGPCCYQVGEDVRGVFAAAGFLDEDLRRWFRTEPITSAANPTLPGVSAAADRWFLDLWRATRDQLLAAGVSPERIFSAELCTASHRQAFCSYRRDGAGAGRLAAAVRARFTRSLP
jgi:YfiH family protein